MRFPKRDRGYGHWVLTVYRVADPGLRAGVNRIMGHRIGWFVVVGAWSVGLCKPIEAEQRRKTEGEAL